MTNRSVERARSDRQVLPYARGRRWTPRPWCVVGLSALLAYPATYAVLRGLKVYYLFYNQGGWELDGSAGSESLDRLFRPACDLELDLQNRLKWVAEPTGG